MTTDVTTHIYSAGSDSVNAIGNENLSSETGITVGNSVSTGKWDWIIDAQRLRDSMPMNPDSSEWFRELRDGEIE